MVHLKIFLAIPLLAAMLSAQAPTKQPGKQAPAFLGPCSNLVCEIENDWSRNNAVLYGLADSVPLDKYDFKPTPAQQSFGERVLHVAQVNLMLLQALGAKTPAPSVDGNATSKAASLAALMRVGEYGVAVIKELGEEGLLARIDFAWPRGMVHGPQGKPPEGPTLPHGALAGHVRAVGCLRADEWRHAAP